MRRLAREVQSRAPQRGPTLLDYGCGKGRFIEEMQRLDLFSEITGYDPAVSDFCRRPAALFDIVTCLDVLDTVEARFVDAVLEDIAQLTGVIAVFDCLTKPASCKGFAPHPPLYWQSIVEKRMRVVATTVEFPGLEGFERVIINAERSD
jgi:Methyltransferase domain